MRVPIPAQLLASRVGPRSRAAARSATLALAVSIVAHSTLGAGEEATSGAAGRTPPSPVSESGSWRTYVWPPIGGAGGDHLTLEIDSPVLLPRPGEGAEAPTVVYEALRGGGESALEIWGWRAEPAGWAELGSFGLFDAGSFSFLGLVPVRGPAAISLRRAWWPAPPVPPVPPDNGGDEEVDLTEQPAVITDCSQTVDRHPAGDGDAEEAVPVSGLLNVTPLYERVREAAKSMAAAHMGQKALEIRNGSTCPAACPQPVLMWLEATDYYIYQETSDVEVINETRMFVRYASALADAKVRISCSNVV